MKFKPSIFQKPVFLFLTGIALFLTLVFLYILSLRWINPLTSSFIVQDRIHLLMKWEDQSRIQRTWVDINEMSPHLVSAVLASEDQKFWEHGGFDWQAIHKTIKKNERDKKLRGASTISQQVAKNLFLWPQKSLFRKGLEIPLTCVMELLWPKERILEIYLNFAQFGRGVYGAEMASRKFFNKPARLLTLSESSLLAAVLPNPQKLSVSKPSHYVRKRSQWIMKQVSP